MPAPSPELKVIQLFGEGEGKQSCLSAPGRLASLCHEESEGRQCLTPPMPPLVVELSCRDIMRGDYILQSARRSGHNLLGVSTEAHR